MKLSTRRYAKRQISWIRNKLLPAINAANSLSNGGPLVPMFLLDATGLYFSYEILRLSFWTHLHTPELGDKWTSNVQNPARQITQGSLDYVSDVDDLMCCEDFLLQNDLPDPLMLSEVAHAMLSVNNKPTSFVVLVNLFGTCVLTCCLSDPLQC